MPRHTSGTGASFSRDGRERSSRAPHASARCRAAIHTTATLAASPAHCSQIRLNLSTTCKAKQHLDVLYLLFTCLMMLFNFCKTIHSHSLWCDIFETRVDPISLLSLSCSLRYSPWKERPASEPLLYSSQSKDLSQSTHRTDI